MREERRKAHPAVAVAVEVDGVGRLRAPHPEVPPTEDGRRRIGADPADRRSFGEGGIVEEVGLDDADLRRAAPQAGQAVERADDDREDEQREERAEPPRAEDGEQAEPLAMKYLPLSSLARSDGWFLVPADSEGYSEGSAVQVKPWP